MQNLFYVAGFQLGVELVIIVGQLLRHGYINVNLTFHMEVNVTSFYDIFASALYA